MLTARPLLVGEDNPLGGSARNGLLPFPRGRAGDRLRRILGLSDREYLRGFERVNLCPAGPWSAKVARDAADRLHGDHHLTGQPLVLLGAKVAAAFGFAYLQFVEVEPGVLVLPHPSGRCRAWNDPAATHKARRALLALHARR